MFRKRCFPFSLGPWSISSGGVGRCSAKWGSLPLRCGVVSSRRHYLDCPRLSLTTGAVRRLHCFLRKRPLVHMGDVQLWVLVLPLPQISYVIVLINMPVRL